MKSNAKENGPTCVRPFSEMRRSVSRVLSRIAISLGSRLLGTSSSNPFHLTLRREASFHRKIPRADHSSWAELFALLPAGFTLPPLSPMVRWALTPPFHPCHAVAAQSGRRRAVFFCGTFRLRHLLVDHAEPGRYPAQYPVELGLSSSREARTRHSFTRRRALPKSGYSTCVVKELCSRRLSIDGKICQAIGAFIFFARNRYYRVRSQFLQSTHHLVIEGLQSFIFHTVLTIDLPHHEFRIRINFQTRRSEEERSLQRQQEGAILRLIVRHLSQIIADLRHHRSTSIGEHCTGTRWPRIPSGGAVTMNDEFHYSCSIKPQAVSRRSSSSGER